MTKNPRESEPDQKRINTSASPDQVLDKNEIHNVCEEVSSDEAVASGRAYESLFATQTFEINNLYDELIGDSDQRRGAPAILEYPNGRKNNVKMAELFRPGANDITMQAEDSDTEHILPLDTFSCIRLKSMPEKFPELTDITQTEIIRTSDGENHNVYMPEEQPLENGLFAYSSREQCKYKYLFFPSRNIHLQYQKRYLGEILLEKGMIKDLDLRNALHENNLLKKKKLGQILAEEAHMLYSQVEQVVRPAFRENPGEVKAGEILVKAGLVDRDQVNAALRIQKKLKKKKIGQFLIEKGIVGEDAVYIALADKFRTPFVDLQKEPISKKALQALPKEIVVKFQVLPISLKHSTLKVATMLPDVPSIKKILGKYTKEWSVQLAVARPSHLRAAIRQLYRPTTT